MSGTVLSTLCSICHAEPPKYKCPACNARTCSVACIQKHKTRADCDGQRNPRAFIPVTELRTPAGIDRDFNFISSIERARQRAEREIIETRHLLHEKEIHPPRPIEQKQFKEVWHGDELRHVPVPLPRQNENINDVVGFDKYVRRRLRALDVEVIMMPRGMSRQKQNTTSWNRRTDTINWQIEWLIYDPQQAEQPLKIFYKSLEGTPLYQALSNTLDYHRACHSKDEFNQPPPSRRHKRKPVRIPPGSPVQDFTSSSWNSPSFTTQSSLLSNWSISTCLPAYPTSQQETLSQYQYFLAKPKAKQLIRLQPATCLTEVLRGRTVIEFPTIFAVSPGGDVSPPGYTILESESDRRAPRVLKNKKPEDDEEDGNSSGEEGQAEEAEAADYNPRKRRFDRMERGGRGGRGRGRGGGGGRGTYRDRDDGRGGKRVRFDSRGRHKGETNNDGKTEAEPAVSDEEGEVQEDMNGMEIDEQAIKQVVEMDIGVMTGTAQPELQGTREKLTAGGLLVDYGSDSD